LLNRGAINDIANEGVRALIFAAAKKGKVKKVIELLNHCAGMDIEN